MCKFEVDAASAVEEEAAKEAEAAEEEPEAEEAEEPAHPVADPAQFFAHARLDAQRLAPGWVARKSDATITYFHQPSGKTADSFLKYKSVHRTLKQPPL